MSWRIQKILTECKEESRKSQERPTGFWEFQNHDLIFLTMQSLLSVNMTGFMRRILSI